MLRAAACAVDGPWAVASRPERVEALAWEEVRREMSGWDGGSHWAVVVEPGADTAGAEAPFPAAGEPIAMDRGGIDVRDVGLDNGARVLILRSPESPVLAVHHMTVGRAALEPAGAEGLTELVHKMIAEGVAGDDAANLERRLRRIGAELKTADLAFIPYDDADTRPDFSFVRLQTLDEYGEDAFRLLADLIHHPTLSPEAFEKARGELVARARMDAKSARHRANALLRESLYGASPAGRDPFGAAPSLESLTREEALLHWERLSDPRHAVLAVATSQDADAVLDWILREVFPGAQPAAAPASAPLKAFWEEAGDTVAARFAELIAQEASSPRAAAEGVEAARRTVLLTDSIGAAQGHVIAAKLYSGVAEEERSLWTAWNAWVSDRLAFRLREERGLAYTIGSSLTWLGPDRALWIASASTRPQNLEEMSEGLAAGTALGLTDPPDEREVRKAVAGAYGRELMRRSTRMKACLHGSLSLLHGREVSWDAEEMERLGAVLPADVQGLAERIGRMDPPTLLIVVS
jgi:zinc protease